MSNHCTYRINTRLWLQQTIDPSTSTRTQFHVMLAAPVSVASLPIEPSAGRNTITRTALFRWAYAFAPKARERAPTKVCCTFETMSRHIPCPPFRQQLSASLLSCPWGYSSPRRRPAGPATPHPCPSCFPPDKGAFQGPRYCATAARRGKEGMSGLERRKEQSSTQPKGPKAAAMSHE